MLKGDALKSFDINDPISLCSDFGFLRAKLIPKSDMLQGWELWGALQCTSLHRNFLEVVV